MDDFLLASDVELYGVDSSIVDLLGYESVLNETRSRVKSGNYREEIARSEPLLFQGGEFGLCLEQFEVVTVQFGGALPLDVPGIRILIAVYRALISNTSIFWLKIGICPFLSLTDDALHECVVVAPVGVVVDVGGARCN